MSNLSYGHNTGTCPLMYTSIPDLIDTKARSIPDKEMYVFWNQSDRKSITFLELSVRSEALAAALLDFGVRPHDRLAVFGRPSIPWVVLDYACLRIQAILVRLPQSLVLSDKLSDFLSAHRCRALFLIEDDPEKGLFKLIQNKIPDVLSQRTPQLKLSGEKYPQYIISGTLSSESDSGTLTIAGILENARTGDDGIQEVRKIQRSIDPEQGAIVYPTSGSTGIPKLVVHSHFSTINSMTGQRPDLVFLNDRLFSWLGSVCYLPAVAGITYVHVDTLSVEGMPRLLSIMEEDKVSMASIPLYALRELVSGLENGDLIKPGTLAVVNTGGEPTPPSIRQRLLRYVPVHIVVYASTEGNPVCVDVALAQTYTPPADDEEPVFLSMAPNVEVRVTDTHGCLVPIGEMGSLWVRSKTTSCGYLDQNEMTSKMMSSTGWVDTGDLAVMSAEHKLFIVGRAIEIISKGACKILPSTVRSAITRHESVSNAFVMGIPDDTYGQEVGAYIINKPGSDVTKDEIIAFCESNMDAKIGISFVPRYVVIADKLPTLASGKVDRLTVQSRLLESGKV